MPVLLAKKEISKQKPVQRDFRLVCSKEQLNKAYQEFEQRFNCLSSNWEWFISTCECDNDPYQEVQRRIEQN